MTPWSSGPWSQTLPSRQGPRVLGAPRNAATAELRQPLLQPGPPSPSIGPPAQPGGRGQRVEQPPGGLEFGRDACHGAAGACGDHLLAPTSASGEPPPRLAVMQGQTGGWAPLGTWTDKHRTPHHPPFTSTQEKPLGPHTQLCPRMRAHPVRRCPHASRILPVTCSQRCTQDLAHPQTCDPPTHSLSPYPGPHVPIQGPPMVWPMFLCDHHVPV